MIDKILAPYLNCIIDDSYEGITHLLNSFPLGITRCAFLNPPIAVGGFLRCDEFLSVMINHNGIRIYKYDASTFRKELSSLLRKMVISHTDEDDLILDMAGSYKLRHVCEELNREYIGFQVAV